MVVNITTKSSLFLFLQEMWQKIQDADCFVLIVYLKENLIRLWYTCLCPLLLCDEVSGEVMAASYYHLWMHVMGPICCEWYSLVMTTIIPVAFVLLLLESDTTVDLWSVVVEFSLKSHGYSGSLCRLVLVSQNFVGWSSWLIVLPIQSIKCVID